MDALTQHLAAMDQHLDALIWHLFLLKLAVSAAVLWTGYQLARAFRELRARLDQPRYGIAWWLNLLTVGCLTVGPVIALWV